MGGNIEIGLGVKRRVENPPHWRLLHWSQGVVCSRLFGGNPGTSPWASGGRGGRGDGPEGGSVGREWLVFFSPLGRGGLVECDRGGAWGRDQGFSFASQEQGKNMHYPHKNSRRKRKRGIGFRARMKTTNGRKLINRKRRAGRLVNTADK